MRVIHVPIERDALAAEEQAVVAMLQCATDARTLRCGAHCRSVGQYEDRDVTRPLSAERDLRGRRVTDLRLSRSAAR